MKNETGSSLIEMLTTVCLIGILVQFMAVSFVDFKESFAQSNARYQLDADLRRLRNEAVAAGAQASIVFNSAGNSYSAGLDYYPFNSNNTPDSTLFTRTFDSRISVTTSRTIVFSSRGYVSDGAGNMTTVAIALRYGSQTYYSATLYATGALA